MLDKEGILMSAKANTGTQDTTYNLLSIVYHALQGAETYEQFINDAEQQGDQELAQFFRDVRDQTTKLADRGKQLLAQRLNRSQTQTQAARQ
jgi:rubrerythrin